MDVSSQLSIPAALTDREISTGDSRPKQLDLLTVDEQITLL
jgi:hypothetical protein